MWPFSGHQVLKSSEGLVFNLVNKYALNYKDEKVLKKPNKLKKINEKSMTTMLRLIILWELGDMREMGSSLKDREINTSADCNTRMVALMMMNFYCGMLDQWKCVKPISRWINYGRLLPSQTSDTLRTGVEPAQNLCSGFVKWSFAVMITTIPRCHKILAETRFYTALFQVMSIIKRTCWICPIKKINTTQLAIFQVSYNK